MMRVAVIHEWLVVYAGAERVLEQILNLYPFPPIVTKPLVHIIPNMAWGIFFLLKREKEYNGEFREWPRRKNLKPIFYW